MKEDDGGFVELEIPGSNKSEEEVEEESTTSEKEGIEEKLASKKIEDKSYIQTKSQIIPKEKIKKQEQNRSTANITKINYRFVGKETITDIIKKIIPPEFTPTLRTAQFLGYIFLGALIISLIRIPIMSLFSANPENNAIKVGLPFSFMSFDLVNPDSDPLKLPGFFVDILIYLILAYIADVSINYFNSQTKALTAKERKKHPKILKINPQKEKNWAEKMTDKVFGED